MRRPTAHRSRRWAGLALGAAALVAVLAMLLGGLRFTVLNDKRFSNSVAASLSKPQVSRFVGERTATQLVNVRPQLQGLEPLIASTMTAVSKSRQVRSLVRVAASQFQRIVIGGDRNAATLVVANLALFITEALKSLRPEVAAQIPSNLAVSMASLQSGGAGAAINDIAHTAQQLRAQPAQVAAAINPLREAAVVADHVVFLAQRGACADTDRFLAFGLMDRARHKTLRLQLHEAAVEGFGQCDAAIHLEQQILRYRRHV